MRAIVLGAGAGGGVPQWNCACAQCRRARAGDPAVPPRTQTALAVSADGERWLLLNASPDLRQQILATPALHPREGPRDSPIAAVLLTGGDVDALGGLLTLREGQPFALYADPAVQRVLDANPVFGVLAHDTVPRRCMPWDRSVDVADAAGTPLGLTVEAFAVPGKVPLYLEGGDPPAAACDGSALGVRVTDPRRGRFLVFMPACAEIDARVRTCLDGADAAFVDGTLYRDDELIRAGLGGKTGRRMGHVSMTEAVSGLAGCTIGRRIFVHVNNSNPALAADGPERATLSAAGWTVAEDGLEIRI
jgi:pyrroloquinoline quinone biosynthesis protein B